MAGRGCSITIQLLGERRDGEDEEISLPVALHAPLEVLRNQLTDITGIPVNDQVLILCDLSDPDRNSDLFLTGRDHLTLRSCGIRSGSFLTLHRLGYAKDATKEGKISVEKIEAPLRKIYSLETEISAADADHR
jgi:hypothetical protein